MQWGGTGAYALVPPDECLRQEVSSEGESPSSDGSFQPWVAKSSLTGAQILSGLSL